ncbi:MAG: response regulator [Povalibacter sp.]
MQPLRILLVEDTALVRMCMAASFREEGHIVHEASNGVQALDALRTQHFDAVVMDLMMPVMDGMEATRQLRSDPVLQSLPVFAYSGMYRGANFDPSLFTALLPKPMAPTDVLAAIGRHIVPIRSDEVRAEPSAPPPPEHARECLSSSRSR